MIIDEVVSNKKQYLDLLLVADEHETMIDRYLDRGRMFALRDDEVRCVAVVLGRVYETSIFLSSKAMIPSFSIAK